MLYLTSILQPIMHTVGISIGELKSKYFAIFIDDQMELVSRAKDFHLRPLLEPYVILSHHTAPLIQPMDIFPFPSERIDLFSPALSLSAI